MILVLDVGNSQIYCGVFQQEELISQFRYASTGQSTSDEVGVFLRGALRENGIDPEAIRIVAISSVVPELNYTLRSCCQKYFDLEPMILRPGLKTGLKIAYKDPKEVGSDRIADAMGAIKLFPNRNLVVVDFGTATTVCAITKDRVFLGGKDGQVAVCGNQADSHGHRQNYDGEYSKRPLLEQRRHGPGTGGAYQRRVLCR